MTKKNAKERIGKLKSLIYKHRYLYHVKDVQEISDEAFDVLKHELFELEQQFPDLITKDSPTQRVGGEPLARFHKVSHTSPMLSIEDIFKEEEFVSWEEYLERLSQKKNLEYFTEVKIDGFAVSLRYEKGVFVLGATRGNGSVGEDVTQNLRTIESIPLRLDSVKDASLTESRMRDIEVRGEVYMEKRDFERFNAKRKKAGQESYANPRNLAAGSIRQLDPKLAASRPLRFIAYDLVSDIGQKTHSEDHKILASLGFKTDLTARICENKKEVLAYWKNMERKRDSLPFHIDGVVVSVNDNAVFENLGVAGKSPRAIRALKFAGSQTTTKIIDVKFQIGRTGAITPVAILNPILLAGVTISRASLHNADEINRLGIKIGDTVVIERAGDVIPSVIKALIELRNGSERNISIPKYCPACGVRLVRPKGEVILRCPNRDCLAQRRENLYYFVSKKAFDIVGLGPKIIDKLVEEHLLSGPSDIFELTQKDLIPLEKFAEKAAKNTVAAIKERKNISLSRFIYALGIRHVGEETAIDLANHFLSLNKLQKASKEELEKVADVGGVVAQSIKDWFKNKKNQEIIKRLFKVGVKIHTLPKPSLSSKGLISGKTFVLTGTLSTIGRNEAKEKIRQFGGNISESVSDNIDYVIVGKNPGAKLVKANKMEIKTLSEKQFLRLLK